MSASDVLFERRHGLGVITLNRPAVINALNHDMVRSIRRQLGAWISDRSVETVLLQGNGHRGLCAGGDVVSIHDRILAGDDEAVRAFWRDEYSLDLLISKYPKPFVSFMDGTVLGGGMGISAHGSHRIVTEASRLGFPEVAIGFVPDVGASWLLSRAPGELGTYLSMTGASVGAGDALELGFADQYVPSRLLPAVAQELEDCPVADVIRRHAAPAPPPDLTFDRAWIDEAFAGNTVIEILERLERVDARRAVEVAAQILSRSPLAVAVALESLRRSHSLLDLRAALEREFTVSGHLLAGQDFAVGIRARLIDRDHAPAWHPARAVDITSDQIDAYFNSDVPLAIIDA